MNVRPAGGPFREVPLQALLASPPPPLVERVGKIAYDGGVTLLAGGAGEGKSFFGFSAAIKVTRGGNLAGLRCEPGTALYVDYENGDALIYQRAVLRGLTAETCPDNLSIWSPNAGTDLARAEDLEALRQLVVQTKANFVVIDSLKSATPSVEENNNDQMARTITGLRDLARGTNAALLVLHHRSKYGTGSRGASAIRDQADAQWILGRQDGDPEARTRRYLKPDKVRHFAEPETLWFAIESAGERVEITEADPPGRGGEPSLKETIADQIHALLTDNPEGLTKAELARRLDRRPDDSTVARALKLLDAQARVLRPEKGKPWKATPPIRLVTSPDRLTDQLTEGQSEHLVNQVRPSKGLPDLTRAEADQ